MRPGTAAKVQRPIAAHSAPGRTGPTDPTAPIAPAAPTLRAIVATGSRPPITGPPGPPRAIACASFQPSSSFGNSGEVWTWSPIQRYASTAPAIGSGIAATTEGLASTAAGGAGRVS